MNIIYLRVLLSKIIYKEMMQLGNNDKETGETKYLQAHVSAL